MAVSVSNLTLTADIFNKSNKMGKTRGNAKIDINVEFPFSDAEITETKVKTMDIPKMPNADPLKNNVQSLTGNPLKRPINIRIIANKLHKKIKLYANLATIISIGSNKV